MKLYKYRSLEHIEYTLDILLNERLHCAPYDKLNDPFEGIFVSVMHLGGLNTFNLGFGLPIGKIRTHKTVKSASDIPFSGHTRICSLSASLSDVRLWSHYANGHRGIAIEIELDDAAEQLHKVDYVDKLQEFGNTLLSAPESTDVLRTKSHHWAYEREYRIISDQEYYAINGKITGVYLGLRTPDLMQNMILKTLGNAIPVYKTKLNETTIEVERGNQINNKL